MLLKEKTVDQEGDAGSPAWIDAMEKKKMDWRMLENLAWTGPMKGAEDLGSIDSTAWTEPMKRAEDLGSIGSTDGSVAFQERKPGCHFQHFEAMHGVRRFS